MVRTLLISLCLTSFASAGVSERDLFEPGDGLLTFDDESGREWLDPIATTFPSSSLADFLETLSSDDRYAGFEFATVEDIRELATSFEAPFVEDSSQFFLVPDNLSPLLLEHLDWNIELTGGILGAIRYTYGLVATSEGMVIGGQHFDGTSVYVPQPAGVSEIVPGAINQPIGPSNSLLAGSYFRVSNEPLRTGPDGEIVYAFWLFRDATAVPEPSTAWLTLAACLGALRLRAFA